MTSAPRPHSMNTIGKRLLSIALIVIFTCVIITVILQPAGISAKEIEVASSLTATPSVKNDLAVGQEVTPTVTPASKDVDRVPSAEKFLQPTPTPQGGPRPGMMTAMDNSGDSAEGTPITSTRGYTNLSVFLANAPHLSSWLVTEIVSTPVDFHLECWGDSSPYNNCKLDSRLNYGNSYSARWYGELVVPSTGEYTFLVADVDDGARLFIDGEPLITYSWDYITQTTATANINLEAGLHEIAVDYENRLQSVASLEARWSGPDFAEEVIPMASQVPECDCTTRLNCCHGEVGGPINTRTGNYDYEQQDFSLLALGEPLKFKRTYNSLKAGTPELGNGWTHNYHLRLVTIPGGLSFESCGGQQFAFVANNAYGANSYQGVSGAGGIITRTGDYGTYTYYLTTANNERYTFDNDGRPTEIRDGRGHTTALTYSGPRLIRVADATEQRYLNFSYDGQGRLIQISDPLSRTIDYGYDAAGDLSVMTDTLGQPWTYTYDGSHRLTEVQNPLAEVVEHTEYDESGRAIRQWQGNHLVVELQYLDTVDEWGLPAQTTIITDAMGWVKTDYYNSRGALMQQTDSSASTSKTFDANYNPAGSTDPNGHPTAFVYNALGRPLVMTDALGNATQMQYDTQNHLTQLTNAAGSRSYYTYTGNLLTAQSDALGHTTIYTYDAQNLLIAQQDTQGRVTEYDYNAWGQRTVVTTTEGVTHYEYDQVGRLITTTDTFNRVTVNVYDNADRLLAVTRNYLVGQPANYLHAYNLTTSYEYDLVGRQIAITDTLGRVNRNVYDENGQLIETIVNYDPARAQNELNQYNITTEYGYDAAGHQILVTDTLGHVSRTDYDVQSRPVTATTNYQDGVYDPAHPDEDIMRVTQYDLAGNAIAQIDPLGRVTRTWYDEVNRVVSTTTNYDPERPQNDQGEYNLITTYGYDQTGNRVWVTDTVGHVTRNYHDATGRLISTTANYLPDHEQNYLNQYNLNTFYGYDGSGRQYLVTNTLGLANHTVYDPLTGRPLTTTTNYVDGVFNPAQPDEDVAQSTEYDAHGNPYIRRDAAGRATRTWYDELNRVISVTNNYAPDRPQNDAGQYNLVTAYGFDEVGNRAWVTDTLGHVTWTQSDALNRAITVTQNYLSGQPPNHLNQYNLVTVYEYDALGRQVAMTDPLGQRTSTEFDQLGRTHVVTDANSHATTFTYDVLGQRTAQTDALQHTTVFTYDQLGRQIATADPLGNTTWYGYDVTGNRVVMTDANGLATRYEYDALTRLSAVIENHTSGAQTSDRDVRTTYAYDAMGNRTVMTNARGYTTTYTYDDLSRPVTQTDPLQHATSQSYDALGNRTALIDANEAETLYGYDDLNRVRVITYTVDETVVYYDYDALGRRTIMTDAVGTTRYAFDELGRLTGVIDPFGQTVSYAYDARGNRTNVIYPDSQVVTYTYDAAGLLTGVTDWDDQTTTYEYDAANRLITVTLPNTVQTVYTYDDANRLIHLSHTRLSDNTLLADYEFTVDEVGNRVRVIEGLELPVDSQFAALPSPLAVPTMADAIVEAITGRRAPGLSAPTLTGTLVSLVNEWVSPVLTINETGQLKTAASHTENSHALIFDSTALWPHLTPFVLDLGDPEEVAADPEVAEVAPAVAYNADDQEYLVVWAAYSDQYDVYARRVLSDGTPSGSSIAVVTDSGSQLSPKVAYGSGVYLVTWHDENSGAIQAQVLQASGTLSGTAFTVSSGSGNNAPAIDYNPEADEFLIAWVYDDEGDGDIHARRVSPDGQVLGSEINVADESGHDLQPALAHDAAGNYLVIFLHPDSSDFGVRGQRLTESGSLSGTAFTVFDGDTSTSNQPDLAYDPDEDHYLVAWREAAGGAYDEIWTRLVSSEGDVLGTAQALDAQTSDYGPAVAYRKDNGAYLVVWSDRRDDNWDAYGRTVDGDGTLLAVPFSLEATEADQTWATVSKQGVAYELLVAYTDSGSGSADIYGERYDASGANFKAAPRSGPGPLTVVLTDTSTATETITSRIWDFGDGITSTVTNPTNVYDEAGCFTVTLEIWTDNSHSLMVKPNYIILAAQAGFTPQPAQGEVPLEVTFANTSYPTEIITAYLWDFGDGYTGTLTSPTHTYATYGLYGVTLTVFSTGGGQSVQTHMVAVGPEPGEAIEIATKGWAHEVRPAAAYNPDAQEYLVVWDDWNSEYDVTARRTTGVGLPIGETFPITTAGGDQYESVVAYGDGIYLVVWSDVSTIWGQRVTAAGELSGEAFTISDGGNSNTAPAIDYNPVAEEFLIVWNRSDEAGDYLLAQRVTPAGVLTGSPIDVISSQAYNPAVAHTTNGAYLVVFVCPDSGDFGVCGQRLSSSGSLVGNVFSIYDDTSNSGTPDLAYDPERDEYLVAWREDLGEGSDPVYAQRLSSSGSLQGNVIDVEASSGDPYRPSVAYHAATQAYLVVWADNSGSDWDIVARSVWADGSGLDNALLAVSAEGNQTYPAISRQGLSGAHFLLYTDDYNGTADIYGQRYLPPLARFSPSPQSGPAPLTVTFTERSTFPTTDSREWDFGDGNASTESDPSHEYLLPGQYTVVFTATWSSRTYTATQAIEVTNPVQAQFTASPLQGTRPLTVTFSDQSQTSSGTITDWQWEFGDGATSDEQHPSHVYTSAGQYIVKLIASTGTYSATEVKTDYISVNPPYQAVITYTYDGLYRLTKATSTGVLTTTFEYDYDAVGNRTTQTATITSTVVTAYQYDTANRLTAREESTEQAYTYAWSDRGQLLAEYYDGMPIRTFTYNAAGQLSEATVLTLTTRFRYNGDGQRLSLEVVDGDTITYTLDYLKAYRVLRETTAQTTTLYLYGHSCLGEWNATDGWMYYLQSTLGQVRQAVNDVGEVIYSWAYNPDGTVLQGVQGPITHLECEAVYDWGTGLIYRLGRYFDPTTGVWLVSTGIVLARAGAKGKRRRQRRLLLLLIMLLCLSGVLAACGAYGPSLQPDKCKEITSLGGDLGDNVKFVGPIDDNNRLPEYQPALKWTDDYKDSVREALTEAVNKFGGPDGFGGGAASVWPKLGVSPDNPIILVREATCTRCNGFTTAAADTPPWIYVYNDQWNLGENASMHPQIMVHELAHYWDVRTNNYGLTDEMLGRSIGSTPWVNWGNPATHRVPFNSKSPEDFPEAVRMYFYWSDLETAGLAWTDDKGDGLTWSKVFYGTTEADQLKLDATTNEPSATGTVEVKDRYDFVQWKLTGTWK